MAYTYVEEFEKRRHHVKEIEFFNSLETWRRYLSRSHPKAVVTVELGIHRAFVGKLRVGVFGKLPGFGNVTSLDVARYFTGKRKRNGIRHRTKPTDPLLIEKRRLVRSAAMKAGWIKRRAKAERGTPPPPIRRLRTL